MWLPPRGAEGDPALPGHARCAVPRGWRRDAPFRRRADPAMLGARLVTGGRAMDLAEEEAGLVDWGGTLRERLVDLLNKEQLGRLTAEELSLGRYLQDEIRQTERRLALLRAMRAIPPAEQDRLRAIIAAGARTVLALGRAFPPPPQGSAPAACFGGAPRLDPARDWPSQAGVPLHFLAQLDLTALPEAEGTDLLPRQGTLLFFAAAGPNEQGGETWPGAVLFQPEPPDAWPPRDPPEATPRIAGAFGHDEVLDILAAHPEGRAVIRRFPAWPVLPQPLTRYEDRPETVRVMPDTARALHDRFWREADRAAFEAAFGPPPRRWNAPPATAPRPDEPPHPLPRRDGEALWLPGPDWPQTRLHALVFARLILDRIPRAATREPAPDPPRRPGLLARLFGAKPPNPAAAPDEAAARARRRHAAIADEARAMLDAAAAQDPFAPPDPAQRAAIRAWVAGLPFDEEGAPLGGACAPARIEEQLMFAFIQGSNAVLGYRASPLPAKAMALLRAWHVPRAVQPGSEQTVRHQLLGTAMSVQGAPEAMGPTHRLLAQFDSDAGLFWSWGDAGVLQFWITPEDLAAHRFGAAVATLEGH